jgi:hypothetical protein
VAGLLSILIIIYYTPYTFIFCCYVARLLVRRGRKPSLDLGLPVNLLQVSALKEYELCNIFNIRLIFQHRLCLKM